MMFDDDGIILEMFSMAVYSRPQYRIGKSLGNNTQSNIHKYACRLARGQTLRTHIYIYNTLYIQTYTNVQTNIGQTRRHIQTCKHADVYRHANTHECAY